MYQIIKKMSHSILGVASGLLVRKGADKHTIRKVLISAYTGLGHFVLKTALVKQIEKLYPGCEISVIAGNTYGTEFVLSGYKTHILKQDSGVLEKIRFFLKLRKEEIDAVFLPCDASPKFLLRGSILAGIPIRIGHVFEGDWMPSYYLTHKVPIIRQQVRSEIDLNLDLLEVLYGKDFPREYRPEIKVPKDDGILLRHALRPGNYICLQMSAANGAPVSKIWFEDRFSSLIQRFIENYPEFKLVALGDSGDSVKVNRICEGFDSGRLINLSGKTSLKETKVLIANCKLLICHDSGLLHTGNALQVPVLSLYGPSDPDMYAVNLPSFHIIRKEHPCSPCLGLFPGRFEMTEAEAAAKCPIPECMTKISVDDVYERCIELIGEGAAGSAS